jgi:predicted DNA-binding transcriptional regulator AlpA
MGRMVDVDDLVDAHEVAALLGLSHANTVHQYQRRYADMPRPVYRPGARRAQLWLRSELDAWIAGRQVGGTE